MSDSACIDFYPAHNSIQRTNDLDSVCKCKGKTNTRTKVISRYLQPPLPSTIYPLPSTLRCGNSQRRPRQPILTLSPRHAGLFSG
jgi:hypothetical protein